MQIETNVVLTSSFSRLGVWIALPSPLPVGSIAKLSLLSEISDAFPGNMAKSEPRSSLNATSFLTPGILENDSIMVSPSRSVSEESAKEKKRDNIEEVVLLMSIAKSIEI